MLKNSPHGWLVSSMEKHLRSLGFAVMVKPNAPSWVSPSGLWALREAQLAPHGEFRGAELYFTCKCCRPISFIPKSMWIPQVFSILEEPSSGGSCTDFPGIELANGLYVFCVYLKRLFVDSKRVDALAETYLLPICLSLAFAKHRLTSLP